MSLQLLSLNSLSFAERDWDALQRISHLDGMRALKTPKEHLQEEDEDEEVGLGVVDAGRVEEDLRIKHNNQSIRRET